MDAELVELATSGATTLVGLMVTDAWTQARDRFVALFGRGRPEELTAELEVVRGEVVAGGDAAEATSELAPKLRRALQNDPALRSELQALLAELAPQVEPGTVALTISGGTYNEMVMQVGYIGIQTNNKSS